jgi:hypothetical protein
MAPDGNLQKIANIFIGHAASGGTTTNTKGTKNTKPTDGFVFVGLLVSFVIAPKAP